MKSTNPTTILVLTAFAGATLHASAAQLVLAGAEVGKTTQSEIPVCSERVQSKAKERLCWTAVPKRLNRALLRFGELKFSNGPSWMKFATARAFVDNSSEVIHFLSFDSPALHTVDAIAAITKTLGSPDYSQSQPSLTWADWDSYGVKVSGNNSSVGNLEIASSSYKEISHRNRMRGSR